MRSSIPGMFITLDGVVEAPHKWNPPYYNQEMTDVVQAQLAASDTHLYGRRSYEMFRSVFTGLGAERIPHAPIMNETAKVLVSSTITDPRLGADDADHRGRRGGDPRQAAVGQEHHR